MCGRLPRLRYGRSLFLKYAVLELVDLRGEPAGNHRGRRALLDDRRAGDDVTGHQFISIIDRRVHLAAVKPARPGTLLRSRRILACAADFLEPEPGPGSRSLEPECQEFHPQPYHVENPPSILVAPGISDQAGLRQAPAA